jgi:hypothetical protein
MGLPYAEETIREAVSILKEEAAIEGDGNCGAIRRCRGVTGCVVTPLSIETVPFLFVLALGRSGVPVFVSGTRGLYRHTVNLSAMENGLRFDLIQERGEMRALYEGCRVNGFELRIMRGQQAALIKLKMDITGDYPPVSYSYLNRTAVYGGERFKEDGVRYWINGTEYTNIYGLTIATRRAGGTQTEVWIHRIMDAETEIPSIIESLEITAQLFRDSYDCGNHGSWNLSSSQFGMFRLSLSRLVLMADETVIDCGDAVVGPLRYYVAGGLNADVFTSYEGVIE